MIFPPAYNWQTTTENTPWQPGNDLSAAAARCLQWAHTSHMHPGVSQH